MAKAMKKLTISAVTAAVLATTLTACGGSPPQTLANQPGLLETFTKFFEEFFKLFVNKDIGFDQVSVNIFILLICMTIVGGALYFGFKAADEPLKGLAKSTQYSFYAILVVISAVFDGLPWWGWTVVIVLLLKSPGLEIVEWFTNAGTKRWEARQMAELRVEVARKEAEGEFEMEAED